MTPKIENLVMTDAIDGSGLVYWAKARRIRRGKHGHVTSFEVRDAAEEGELPVAPSWTRINAATISAARMRLITGECAVRRDLAAQFVGKNWEYDADGVDALIQCACFNEITFG